MKSLILLIAAYLIVLPAFAQTPADPMRNFIWGVPKEAVRDYETATFVGEEEGRLIYQVSMRPDMKKPPVDVYVAYEFMGNKLNAVRYNIPVDGSNPAAGLDNMLIWQSWLDGVYQQTSTPRFWFRAQTLRNDPARWGWAIYRGDGSVTANWNTTDTKAVLSLTGNREYEPRFSLVLTPAQP